MILGIGTDLTEISRISAACARHDGRFAARILTAAEQADLSALPPGPRREAALAKRWAAKEACVKALGTGFSDGISWQDIELFHAPSGQPGLRLSGRAQERLQQMLPAGMCPRLDLSLSDEKTMALAFVVISAQSAAESLQETTASTTGIPR